MVWYEFSMVLVGIGLLMASMRPIAQILKLVESGHLHRSWRFLRALIVLLILGYTCILGIQFGNPPDLLGLIGSWVLVAGGAFVFTVAQLSALTTADLVRIAKLESDVVRDPLTGAFNRRYMDAYLPVVVANARRTSRPLSALLVDLDHFKRVNDTYGHAVGDLVLKKVSSLLIESSRAGDAVIRYGGEEFVVIAQETGSEAAAALGERMRQRIHAEAIPLPDGREIQATASIGVAALSLNNDQDDLLGRADQALYAAKANGRNQVCAAA